MIHELKILPKYFDDIKVGKKTFEVRKNDRGFKEGDMLALNEFDPIKGYTGNSIVVYVDYIMNDLEYIKEGYVIMGIKPCLVDVVTDIYDGHKSEWISVDERLPTPYVSVLVYMPDEMPHPTVREGFINKQGEWYAGGFDRLPDEVVSWRAMPEAPKMKGGAV